MRTQFDATGEVLVVTGGTSGIGLAVATAYARAGGSAHVFGTRADPELPDGVTGHRVDVADREEVFAAVGRIVAQEGRIDGLVAGAAVQPRTPVAETDPAEWQRTLDVNLTGVVWATQAVLPTMMAARRGTILAFSSGLANVGHANASAYAATKGALVPWIKSLAAEVAEYRIRANVVFPGVIDTPQFRKANPAGGELEHWKTSTGVGSAEDVVGPLMFLLSDAASMSGSVLTRDRAFGVEDD
ncbi:SDR family NAD(P)-dependent oxidoreductase [Microbacterium resistens]|uniref:SDR family oxidoreductase n=1 Tax=Microbacterium resistens TaxID=156977 RepID=A0ABY3RMW8_9MICO|nr:SDR family oxidoreductase [Microbacterium resistens]MBW1639618.1 SDR family oxidoreductase [Microbacterium resistens]UGS25213.1 SDR family oxidoreductase [Microbacterium resistens]